MSKRTSQQDCVAKRLKPDSQAILQAVFSQHHILKRILSHLLQGSLSNARQWLDFVLVSRRFRDIAYLPTVRHQVARLVAERNLDISVGPGPINCGCVFVDLNKRSTAHHVKLRTFLGYRYEARGADNQLIYRITKSKGVNSDCIELFGGESAFICSPPGNTASCAMGNGFQLRASNVDRIFVN